MFGKNIDTLCVVFILIILFQSCNESHTGVLKHAQTIDSISCTIEEIRSKTDSMWVRTMDEVEMLLPEDMPKRERRTMITLKNAELIRLIDSYDRLGSEVHGKIDAMEAFDQKMADSIRTLNFHNQELRMELELLLGKIKSKETLEKVRLEIASITSDRCL